MDSAPLDEPAFVIDDEPVTWGAVVAHARRTGVWRTVETTTREGIACLSLGPPPSRAQVREAAADWRTRRRLTAGEDMEAWLAFWGLDVRAFLDHVRRTVARDAHPDDADALARDHPADEEHALERRAWATAVCSGTVERSATTLAERLAVRARLVEAGSAEATDDLDTVWALFRQRVVTPSALEDMVQARQLDWVRVTGDVLVLGSEDAAREARLCLLDDGATTAELAAEHHIERRRRTWFLDDVPEGERPVVLAAQRGDVLGPLERDAGWTLMAVTDRITPSLDDSSVRTRAEQQLISRVARKEVEDRVMWMSRP